MSSKLWQDIVATYVLYRLDSKGLINFTKVVFYIICIDTVLFSEEKASLLILTSDILMLNKKITKLHLYRQIVLNYRLYSISLEWSKK